MSGDTRGFPSKNAVRRAGSMIRAFQRGEAGLDAMDDALTIIEEHRARHALPLVKVNNGLGRFCRSLGIDGEVTQRLKKVPTIMEKLIRESGLDLSRMQDIGGCRVVVGDVQQLRLLQERIRTTLGERICRDTTKISHDTR